MFRLLANMKLAKAEKARKAAVIENRGARARRLTQIQHVTQANLREANHASLRASVAAR